MTVAIQARIPDDLADEARRRARERELSLSAYLADLVRRDVAAARTEAFWAEVDRTMTTEEAFRDLTDEAEAWSSALPDAPT